MDKIEETDSAGKKLADDLMGEMTSVEALATVKGAEEYLRQVVVRQRDELNAALGSPTKPTRAPRSPQRPAPPTTQAEAAERVRQAMVEAKEPLSVKALAKRTGVPGESIKAILVGLGAVQHGLKYALKAGT